MLDKTGFFQGLDARQLRQIEQAAERRSYGQGVIIMGQDDDTDYLCVLLSGTVQAYVSDEQGKRIIVNTMTAGQWFGELAMLSGEPRSANVVAVEDCEVMLVQRDAVMQAFEASPAFCCNVIRRLAKKVNDLTEEVSCLALMDVYGRIVRLLEQDCGDGEGRRLTQQDIADRVGSSREMVSRILKDLRIGGYIEIRNRCIHVIKPLPHGW